MARRGRGDGRVRRALEGSGIAWWARWARSARWTGQAGGGQDYGPPRSNRRGREKGAGKKKSPPDAAMAPTGERRCASGARLVTDWPPLLPPCVKTQMACCGWSEAPVS